LSSSDLQKRALLCRLTAEEFDPHSKVSRLYMAAASVAMQRSSMAAGLPPMRTATTGLSGMPPPTDRLNSYPAAPQGLQPSAT